eukprot:SAG31_NODE_1486_length_8148_cov_6.234439_1_plen_26_part_10
MIMAALVGARGRRRTARTPPRRARAA